MNSCPRHPTLAALQTVCPAYCYACRTGNTLAMAMCVVWSATVPPIPSATHAAWHCMGINTSLDSVLTPPTFPGAGADSRSWDGGSLEAPAAIVVGVMAGVVTKWEPTGCQLDGSDIKYITLLKTVVIQQPPGPGLSMLLDIQEVFRDYDWTVCFTCKTLPQEGTKDK